MTPDERKHAAQSIVAIPLFNEIMDELETSAINRAVAATQSTDDERQSALLAVRSIRNLRSTIRNLAEGQPSERKKAPA